MTVLAINQDIERYKKNTLTVLMIIAYTFMHYRLNGLYTETTFEKLTAFQVIKPYANRLLLPILAHELQTLLPLPYLYLIFEATFVSLIVFVTRKLFCLYCDSKESYFYSLLFIGILCLVYIINYRFAAGREGTFFFPYDTPAVFFTLLGLYLVLTKQLFWVYILVPIATLNRESSLLIILMLPALFSGTKTPWIKPFLITSFIYGLTRIIIAFLLRHHQGSVAELYNLHSHYPHLTENIYFLMQRDFFTWILAEMGFLPLIWFTFSNYIPKALKHLKFVVLFYIIALFIVGNIIEGRLFGEVVAILFLPSMLAIKNYLNNNLQDIDATNIPSWISKQAVPLILIFTFFMAIMFFIYTAK